MARINFLIMKKNYNFLEKEQNLMDFWEENEIYKFGLRLTTLLTGPKKEGI